MSGRGFPVRAGLALGLLAVGILAGAASATACDIARPHEIRWQNSESAPGWNVYAFTDESGIDGFMLYRHLKRRQIPAGAEEKKLLETEIGKAATALYKRKPSRIVLDTAAAIAPADWVGSGLPVRQFALTLSFGEAQVRAYGYVRTNKGRKDIALIVAMPDAAHGEEALGVARRLAGHPGFDCGAGDSP
jgi:hypothetical protein